MNTRVSSLVFARRSLAAGLLFTVGFALGITKATAAAQTGAGYNLPPKNILDVMLAPTPPMPVVSPTHKQLLLVSWQPYPSIDRVSTPFLRLAGARIEPANHSKHDTPNGYGITPCAIRFELISVPNGTPLPVALPAGVCASAPIWSADGQRFAFANIAKTSVELWVGDGRSGALQQVPGVRLNPMFEHELSFMPDQHTLLIKMVPGDLGAVPAASAMPVGPSVQESLGQKGESSTYEVRDTLNNTHDEEVFDYFAASQLALVDANSLKITPIGPVANYFHVMPSPDGQHVLLSYIHKPYSYITTYDRFPHEVEVWDLVATSAKMVRHPIASLPLADRVPVHGVALGPRDFTWRATAAATLVWAEALDGGDWKVKVPFRDRLMMQSFPFSTTPTEIVRTEQRFIGFEWSDQPQTAFLYEEDQNRHWHQTYVIDVDAPTKKRLLWDLSSDERYANPGDPVMEERANGTRVIKVDNGSIYLSGVGASPDGDRPFLDRLDLKSFKTQRLFRSDKQAYERFLAFAGPTAQSFLTWHQSVMDPPNAYLRTLGPKVAASAGEAIVGSSAMPVTRMLDPAPAVRGIQKRLVKYKRADGLDLSFTLYTPPGYKPGTRLPTILYAYPLDYADASKAGQVSGSQMTFTQLRQYRLLLLAGYAIIDNASFPIVGDPKKAYDTYLEQLVADAKAAVDEAVRLGVTDPLRVGVTGHSHGALMTVNLVAHSDLFKAGIATSGSYNKTLTPFGFQNERRSVWDAPDVYLKVSPFFMADKIKTPLLLIHGAEDANPGTTPLQSIKLFEAIRGNGGTTRLVMLPHEPHWYTALESNEQEVYEMIRWFDQYVKDPAPNPVASTAAAVH